MRTSGLAVSSTQRIYAKSPLRLGAGVDFPLSGGLDHHLTPTMLLDDCCSHVERIYSSLKRDPGRTTARWRASSRMKQRGVKFGKF
jgi:hypothetical protein